MAGDEDDGDGGGMAGDAAGDTAGGAAVAVGAAAGVISAPFQTLNAMAKSERLRGVSTLAIVRREARALAEARSKAHADALAAQEGATPFLLYMLQIRFLCLGFLGRNKNLFPHTWRPHFSHMSRIEFFCFWFF